MVDQHIKRLDLNEPHHSGVFEFAGYECELSSEI